MHIKNNSDLFSKIIQKGPKYRLSLIVLLCLILPCPKLVYAWSGRIHSAIARDALGCFSEQIQKKLVLVLIDINEPDINRVVSHVNISSCAWMIEKLAKQAIGQIKNGENWDLVFSTIGKCTHYIQDLNCPHHGIGTYIRGAHEIFERNIVFGFWEEKYFDGFNQINDFRIFAFNAARFSRRYIELCNRSEIANPSSPEYKELVDPVWDHTVNDVIDLWLTILWDGLGEQKYNEWGLPEMRGTRSKQRIKYPKIVEGENVF